MVGTLDDKPLLVVVVDDTTYFVDLDTKIILQDKPGLPELHDKDLAEHILKAADELE